MTYPDHDEHNHDDHNHDDHNDIDPHNDRHDDRNPIEPSTAMTPQTFDDNSAELAALVALDAVDETERPDAERDIDRVAFRDFEKVTATLADAVSEIPPHGLRESVMTAATARRRPGAPVSSAGGTPVDGAGATAGETFRRTVDELRGLLMTLTREDWKKPALAVYGTVHDLVAHLVGVEEGLLGTLGYGPSPDPAVWSRHTTATTSTIEELRETPTEILVERWTQAANRLAGIAEEMESTVPDRLIPVNDVPAGPTGMLVLRTFEVWTHHEDICRATGHPLPNLDANRLRRMSGDLINALPVALAVHGVSRPDRTTRLVLTGDGGGTFDIPMAIGGAVGQPDTLIVADVVDFCRLASHRLTPPTLGAHIEGDIELAGCVLQAAGAFARD